MPNYPRYEHLKLKGLAPYPRPAQHGWDLVAAPATRNRRACSGSVGGGNRNGILGSIRGGQEFDRGDARRWRFVRRRGTTSGLTSTNLANTVYGLGALKSTLPKSLWRASKTT